jgi:hypothetical protein
LRIAQCISAAGTNTNMGVTIIRAVSSEYAATLRTCRPKGREGSSMGSP